MISSHQIDIEKSKLNDKIYLKKNSFENILFFIFRCFVSLILPLNTILYLIENYKDFHKDIFGFVMMNIASFLIGFFIYKSFTFTRGLKRFKGKDLKSNKAKILKIAADLELNFIYNEQEIVTLAIDNSTSAIIIFDNQDLLVSIDKQIKYRSNSIASIAISLWEIRRELVVEEKTSSLLKKIEALAQPQPF